MPGALASSLSDLPSAVRCGQSLQYFGTCCPCSLSRGTRTTFRRRTSFAGYTNSFTSIAPRKLSVVSSGAPPDVTQAPAHTNHQAASLTFLPESSFDSVPLVPLELRGRSPPYGSAGTFRWFTSLWRTCQVFCSRTPEPIHSGLNATHAVG